MILAIQLLICAATADAQQSSIQLRNVTADADYCASDFFTGCGVGRDCRITEDTVSAILSR